MDVVIAELSDDCDLDKLSKVIEEKKDLEVLVNNAVFSPLGFENLLYDDMLL